MTITFRPLSELPIKEVSELWNQAFEGYFVPAAIPLERFISRTATEGLSLEHSFACYVDGEPAGLVMNGFREQEDRKLAWNGGTAIVPAFRNKGIGKALMQRNLELYEELGVSQANLEAISQNDNAIRLYEGMGYEQVDRLLILSTEKPIPDMDDTYEHPYQIALGMAAEAARLPLYSPGEVWQADLPSLKDGESVAVFDGGEAAGYALYRRTFSPDGMLTGIVLYRLEVAAGRTDTKDIMLAALHEVWQPGETCRRSAFNIRASHTLLVELLTEMGLTATMEQVLMIRDMSEAEVKIPEGP
ncbi:Acetyltransferase (GNAT) family protein [Paenibacillus catalpae]|uniref:Acetyltransferase (GNAT) family protein n=1 Tax=Paenibacillus catalpae TaxID=1045775 RepID=A0A1I2AZP9_9BACL|nr:GNAT family N-acetyltransferase [Paenibacillus catalpae]SFE49118.1 Acetyltransferase (GNAT) family protein [Paenibacillus catalpae]